MNYAQYQRKRAKVEDARRRHFITPKCEQSLLKTLALQLRREGAAPYLVAEYDLDKHEARKVLREWMHTFAERHPEEGE